ncbi:hypothetical protein HHI36_017329 [Cryptolaemus montrouzieri]|uniref:Alpha/beta hydrolase fold-3 domain-containing protein n=1 Tax=Cryptolaemus montrouzieri TaxID=559131 RepID=A0ABD2NMM1_9CUCU
MEFTHFISDSPIIFFIHGGYWQEEIIGRNNSSFVSEVFYKKGIKSFIIGYELCPTVQLDDIIQQTEKALRVCLEYAKNKKSSGIYLMGHSAGAHLVVHFFSRFREIVGDEDVQLFKAAFLIGGVYDLSPLLLTSYNKALKLTTDSAKKFSPMEQVITKSDVEFFVIVGENDSPAFISQSEEFDKKLKLQDVTSKLVILKNIDHFNIVEKLTEEEFPLTELILKIVMKNE